MIENESSDVQRRIERIESVMVKNFSERLKDTEMIVSILIDMLTGERPPTIEDAQPLKDWSEAIKKKYKSQ